MTRLTSISHKSVCLCLSRARLGSWQPLTGVCSSSYDPHYNVGHSRAASINPGEWQLGMVSGMTARVPCYPVTETTNHNSHYTPFLRTILRAGEMAQALKARFTTKNVDYAHGKMFNIFRNQKCKGLTILGCCRTPMSQAYWGTARGLLSHCLCEVWHGAAWWVLVTMIQKGHSEISPREMNAYICTKPMYEYSKMHYL